MNFRAVGLDNIGIISLKDVQQFGLNGSKNHMKCHWHFGNQTSSLCKLTGPHRCDHYLETSVPLSNTTTAYLSATAEINL